MGCKDITLTFVVSYLPLLAENPQAYWELLRRLLLKRIHKIDKPLDILPQKNSRLYKKDMLQLKAQKYKYYEQLYDHWFDSQKKRVNPKKHTTW